MTKASRFGARRLVAPTLRPTGIAWLLYTGGTTGRPKGVIETHSGVATMTNIQMAEWDWPAHLRTLCVTPLSHAASTLFLPTLLRGGSLAVMPSFDPDRLIDTIERLRITVTFLVPTMIYRLLDHARLDTADLSSLQTLFYGASAISPTRLAEAIERLGPIFFQFYGQAECPTTITVLTKNDHRLGQPDRLASCGRPVPWLDVELLDDDGHAVPAGDPVRSAFADRLSWPAITTARAETAEALRGGWLHTGDVATADDKGFLTIIDRKKDMIVTGGFNVFPERSKMCCPPTRTYPRRPSSAYRIPAGGRPSEHSWYGVRTGGPSEKRTSSGLSKNTKALRPRPKKSTSSTRSR